MNVAIVLFAANLQCFLTTNKTNLTDSSSGSSPHVSESQTYTDLLCVSTCQSNSSQIDPWCYTYSKFKHGCGFAVQFCDVLGWGKTSAVLAYLFTPQSMMLSYLWDLHYFIHTVSRLLYVHLEHVTKLQNLTCDVLLKFWGPVLPLFCDVLLANCFLNFMCTKTRDKCIEDVLM